MSLVTGSLDGFVGSREAESRHPRTIIKYDAKEGIRNYHERKLDGVIMGCASKINPFFWLHLEVE